MNRGQRVITGIGAVIVTTLLMSSAAFAHPGFGPGRLGMTGMRTPLLDELQLTGDQRTQVETIFVSGRDAVRALVRQLWEMRTPIREAARTEPFDEAQVRAQAQEAADVHAQLIVARAQLINQVRGVLTEEQKVRLDELQAQRLEQFREWRRQHRSKLDQPRQ